MCRQTQAKLTRDLQRECNVWLAEPIGVTCFEHRTENHSCNDVVLAVDSNTNEDNKALRCLTGAQVATRPSSNRTHAVVPQR